MEHKGTKTIETNRLLLRKFCAEDTNAAYANWTSDEKVTEFLRWPTHTFVETTEMVIKDWISDYKCNLLIVDGDDLKFEKNPEDFEKVTDMIDAKMYGLFSEQE